MWLSWVLFVWPMKKRQKKRIAIIDRLTFIKFLLINIVHQFKKRVYQNSTLYFIPYLWWVFYYCSFPLPALGLLLCSLQTNVRDYCWFEVFSSFWIRVGTIRDYLLDFAFWCIKYLRVVLVDHSLDFSCLCYETVSELWCSTFISGFD